MKIIFLDFDGVLNSEKYVRGREGLALDPACMVRLKQIVDATGARIVLTTSWREHWKKDAIGTQMEAIFRDYGLEISDLTPSLPNNREGQIGTWLEQHPAVSRFVVLDDRLLCAPFLKGHFVKTSNYYNGLDDADVQQAIEILNEGG